MKRLSHHISSAMLGLFLVCIARSVSADFSDVYYTNYNIDAINYVESEGIVSGYPDGTFRPDQKINRAEFTKIIMKTINDDILSAHPDAEGYLVCDPKSSSYNPEISFSDVLNEWFADFVCVAAYYDIIHGYPDGTFRPEEHINFAEAAKIIARSFSLIGEADPDIWYKEYVVALENANAIPTSIVSFDGYISRAEMAEIIYRIHGEVDSKHSKTYGELEEYAKSETTLRNENLGFSVTYPASVFELNETKTHLYHRLENFRATSMKDGSTYPAHDISLTFKSDTSYCNELADFFGNEREEFEFNKLKGYSYLSGVEGEGIEYYCVRDKNGDFQFLIERGFLQEVYSLSLIDEPDYLSTFRQKELLREVLTTFEFLETASD